MKLMTTPYTGPRANAPAGGQVGEVHLDEGRDEHRMGNSMNIRMNATALSMAATVRLWVVSFLIIFLPGRLPPFK